MSKKKNINNSNIIKSGNNNKIENKQKFNKSNQNNIDNSKEINKTININKIPKRMTAAEREAQRQETLRPSLKERVGEDIICFGYIVGKYGKYDDRYTVINIVDNDGNFCADHIQLDFKTDEYDYTYDKGDYIKITGKVKPYERYDGSEDYTIDIFKKVDIWESRFDYLKEVINYEEIYIDYEYIDQYLSTVNITKIYDIIESLRRELNNLTKNVYCEDFIYYYIINQYTINTATYKIYNGELRDQNFNEDMILELLLLLGSTLFELKSKKVNYLDKILNLICQQCNLLQGIKSYEGRGKFNEYDELINPSLIEFYKKNLFYGKKFNKVGQQKIKDAWRFIYNRKNNFNQEKPYEKHITEESIKMRSYHMINYYIPKR